jgi:hypothetical protein
MEVSSQLHASAAFPPPNEISPSTHWIGGWMGLTASVDAMEKRKILTMPGIESWPSSLSLYQMRYPSYSEQTQNSSFHMPAQTPISCLLVARPCYHPKCSRMPVLWPGIGHATRYSRLGTMTSKYPRSIKFWDFPITDCSDFGLLCCSSSLAPPLGLSDHDPCKMPAYINWSMRACTHAHTPNLTMKFPDPLKHQYPPTEPQSITIQWLFLSHFWPTT